MIPTEKSLEKARAHIRWLICDYSVTHSNAEIIDGVMRFFEQALNEARSEALEANEILDYCAPYYEQMWAASIAGMIWNIDFRDAALRLKSRVIKSNDK